MDDGWEKFHVTVGLLNDKYVLMTCCVQDSFFFIAFWIKDVFKMLIGKLLDTH